MYAVKHLILGQEFSQPGSSTWRWVTAILLGGKFEERNPSHKMLMSVRWDE